MEKPKETTVEFMQLKYQGTREEFMEKVSRN